MTPPDSPNKSVSMLWFLRQKSVYLIFDKYHVWIEFAFPTPKNMWGRISWFITTSSAKVMRALTVLVDTWHRLTSSQSKLYNCLLFCSWFNILMQPITLFLLYSNILNKSILFLSSSDYLCSFFLLCKHRRDKWTTYTMSTRLESEFKMFQNMKFFEEKQGIFKLSQGMDAHQIRWNLL